MVIVQKHGITKVHAQKKKHGNTMVPFQIQFKMDGRDYFPFYVCKLK